MSIEVGLERTESFVAADRPLTDVGGTLAVVSAALEGATCSVHARLREVVDGRKLCFDVEVTEDGRTIGVGTHERRVVHRAGRA